MKELFYYLRDDKNRPIITVCLIAVEEGTLARGVAICSDKDQPNKKIGRAIARGRAIKALKRKKMGDGINRNEAWEIMERLGVPFTYKSYYNTFAFSWEEFLFELEGVKRTAMA